MNTKTIVAALAGAVVFLLLGYLIYVQLLSGFFEESIGGSGIMRAEPDLLYVFIGNLGGACLLALIYDRWAGIKTFATGAKAGAIIGALFAVYAGFIQFGTTTISSSLTPYLVDVVVSAVMWAIVGGIVGLILGRGADS